MIYSQSRLTLSTTVEASIIRTYSYCPSPLVHLSLSLKETEYRCIPRARKGRRDSVRAAHRRQLASFFPRRTKAETMDTWAQYREP